LLVEDETIDELEEDEEDEELESSILRRSKIFIN